MTGDLPDYSKKVIVIYEGTITGGEVLVDHRKILGVALKDPTFAKCIPISIENDAIAYEPVNDRFKVDIQAMTVGTLDVDIVADSLGGLKIVEKNATGLKVDLVTDTLAGLKILEKNATGVKFDLTTDTLGGLKIIEKLAAGVKVNLTTDTLAGLKVLEKNATGIKVDIVTDTLAGLKAIQATRTNLKVKPEREDVLTKSFDLTVGTTSLLSAVASQYHKVYGWDYEADTDGANEFSATISATACKFARRITLGVHDMTLIHPIVCDVNTALSFISAGNTKLSLRYKTEA